MSAKVEEEGDEGVTMDAGGCPPTQLHYRIYFGTPSSLSSRPVLVRAMYDDAES